MGLAPTGSSIAYDEIFVLRFADGRITQTWGVVDVFAQLKQLGFVLPQPEQENLP
jgi:predicted ester cyclase